MNQILNTKLEKNNKTSEKKNWFKFQFTLSIFIIIIAIFGGSFYFYHLRKQENFSNNLINNYNIYRLYSTTQNDRKQENSNNGLFRNY